jgi:hypothetical protein
LLAVIVRSVWRGGGPARPLVLAGCAALAVGTLQGPVQAFPAVNELLDRGGDPGDIVVNLHAQLNMLGGLMAILIALAFLALRELGAPWPRHAARIILPAVGLGMAVYYAGGIAFAAVEAHRVEHGVSFASALAALEPWQALVLVPAALAVLVGFWTYARAAWRLTAEQRAEGRRALVATPGLYTGKIPNRVRRRRPATLAGYELPLGLMGFPGVGWLFAGFPFTASILLCAGPALAWAVIPAAFSPFGQGPLRAVGWKVELAYLPASALLSSALLYRAHARRRALFLGRPPRSRGTRLRSSYRTRVSVAAGAILLLLVSLPFLPAVAGLGASSVRYSHQTRFTSETTGQYLAAAGGPVKLFSWSDPQYPYPPDALRVRGAQVRSLLVRAAAVDAPAAYQLYDLDRGGSVPLRVRERSATTLTLAPGRTLPPGRYAFVAAHEGMFGGRDYDYLTVVRPGEAVTAIASNPNARAPAVAAAVLPVATVLVALLFAFLLLRSYRARPAGQKAFWALGFALFAAAAACEAAAQRSGWSPALFRAYYLCGGVLTVAYLGAGSAWLKLRPRGRDVLLGALAVASAAAIATVVLAPVDTAALAATAGGRPPPNGAIGGHAFLWAIALNSFGTIFLVGGSALSILRRQRVRTNLWIGGGALVVALATGLSRSGDYSLVYAGELVGVALMFCGFTLGSVPKRRRAPALEPAAVAP